MRQGIRDWGRLLLLLPFVALGACAQEEDTTETTVPAAEVAPGADTGADRAAPSRGGGRDTGSMRMDTGSTGPLDTGTAPGTPGMAPMSPGMAPGGPGPGHDDHADHRGGGAQSRGAQPLGPGAAAGVRLAPGFERSVGARASGRFLDLQGRQVGNVRIEEGPSGVVVRGEVTGLTPGEHGFHFHETGRCEPPFETAGAHLSPEGRRHGFLSPAGFHAGDLPNVVADDDGRAAFEFHAVPITIGTGDTGMLGGDGLALVVHAGADDHRTDPSGGSGDRVACAVIGR